MKSRSSRIKNGVILAIMLIVVNVLAFFYFKRFDLTQNHRYTLSKPSKEIIQNLEKPVMVRVFLKGDFPANFRRLENETRYLLEEYSAYNRRIKFEFINPLQQENASAEAVGKQFMQAGMPPKRLNIRKNGELKEQLLFPWAIATYRGKSVKIPLLKMTPGASNKKLVDGSVQNLEYAFSNALKKLTTQKNKKIAILKGNGELPDIHIASFLKAIGVYYHVAPFTLDSVAKKPQQTLQELEKFNLIVVAKPTHPFSEKEKYVLDQYLMNGGKALWLVEAVRAEKDSLFSNPNHVMVAYPYDLHLLDFFFTYGVRIMPSLINDLHSDKIVLASGKGKQTQFNRYLWPYAPLAVTQSNNPIVHNIAPVRFNFANPMDTLKNGIQKTVLLKSSIATRVEGTPEEIRLNQIIGHKPNFKTYRSGSQNLAVLLEGRFTSVYKNRIKPFSLPHPIAKSKPTKMIVISDGDVINNRVVKGQPTSLAYDSRTGESYGNLEFLLNATNYMLDDSGLLSIRTKKVNIPFLDSQKIAQDKLFWQVVNLGGPLVLLVLFGIGFNLYRKRKYRA